MSNSQLKFINIFLSFILFSVSLFLVTESAEARRMGFGRSIGKSPPIKRQVTPPPSQATKKPATTPTNSSNVTNNQSRGGFMAPLAGLAAGFGLAALASYMGVGEELMGLLLIILAFMAVFFVFRYFQKISRNKTVFETVPESFNKSNLSSETDNEINKKKTTLIPLKDSKICDPTSLNITQEEKNTFLENSKKQFIELQNIWDSGDIEKLKSFCTDEMAQILRNQISEIKNTVNITSITELNASWEGDNFSVIQNEKMFEEIYINFYGMVRESKDDVAKEFSEIWTLQRVKSSDQGWLLAGISQPD
tara:strand:+ start:1913 stop:2833 length:921 start_codon:yes stop_codon:yes gene_type:complete